MEGIKAKATAYTTLVSILGGGVVAVDTRYATSEQVTQLESKVEQKAEQKDLKTFILNIQKWELRRLKREASLIRLKENPTDIDRFNLEHLEAEIEALEAEIQ